MAVDDYEDDDLMDPPPRIRDFLRPLLPLMIVGFIDAVSFMIITPSLVFYVLQQGGTKEQYGIILAVFSFSSFLFKPVLAYWSDSIHKFRPPYLMSIVVAGLGGLVYFLASAFSPPPSIGSSNSIDNTQNNSGVALAVIIIFLGRFLGGCGAANNTLGFTYIAYVIPKDLFTQGNALLSMVRVIGMAISPAFNGALAFVNATIPLWGSYSVVVDPLNSVGLLMAFGNLLAYFAVYFLFEEPMEMVKPASELNDPDDHGGWRFWRNLLRFDILVPILSTLVLNANFQLMETGLAPASNDALGWEPVRISALYGVNSIVILGVVVLTFVLSARGVKDIVLMMTGLVFSIVGYTLMYLWWRRGAEVLMFVTPAIVCCMVFPFLASPTRSLFTIAVANHPQLRHNQGTMQAIMSMVVSVSGFAAPGLIAAYVLRSPEQVAASADQREFTPWALLAPILSGVILVLVVCIQRQYPEEAKLASGRLTEDDLDRESFTENELAERLALLGNVFESDSKVLEATRRNTIMMMGIPSISLHGTSAQKLQRHTLAW